MLTETWLRFPEQIPTEITENFHCLATYHNPPRGRPYGGVLLGVRRNTFTLTPLHVCHETDCVWARLAAPNNYIAPFVVGLHYIPPQGTARLQHTDPFEFLREQALRISDPFLIAGDFNARTGTVVGRESSDSTINQHGLTLTELCQTSGLLILNGTLPGDSPAAQTFSAKTAENAGSVIDYFIASPNLPLRHGASLQILQSPQFRAASDHWPLVLTLPFPCQLPSNTKAPRRKHRRRRHHPPTSAGPLRRWVWDPGKSRDYAVALQAHASAFCPNSSDEPSQPPFLFFKLRSAIALAAKAAELTTRPLIPVKRPTKPVFPASSCHWFNSACRQASLSLLNSKSGPEARQAYRHYKNILRRAKRSHIQAREAKLRDLLISSPRSFWNLVKKPQHSDSPTPSPTSLFDHFSSMRTHPPPLPQATTSPITTAHHHIHAPHPAPHTPPPTTLNHRASPFFPTATSLNKPFTIGEIQYGMSCLQTGKAADVHGITAELLRAKNDFGSYILAPSLLSIANETLRTGIFPAEENVGRIIALYKGKGDSQLPSHYRGITIISIFAKLFATLLNARLTQWRLGTPYAKAKGQAGFLKNYRTMDQAFILQHLIDKAWASAPRSRSPLYTCFVDFEKAFDWVNRDLLWSRLDSLGVRGPFLMALRGYYTNSQECVQTTDGLSSGFASHRGVKQGCPISPTLFGIFIDALEEHIIDHMGQELTIRIRNSLVPVLLYADDLILLASSPKELQHILDTLEAFCDKWELSVNLPKTKTMVFTRSRTMPALCCNFKGAPVEQSCTYMYLGLEFHWQQGLCLAGKDRLLKGRKASFALDKALLLQQITSPKLCLQFFDALVRSVCTYGAELWGAYDNLIALQQLQSSFIRRVLHAPKSTDIWILCAEANTHPIQFQILQSQQLFWSRLAEMGRTQPSRLVSLAFQENVSLLNTGKRCWCQKFLQRLQQHLPHFTSPLSEIRWNTSLPVVDPFLLHIGALQNTVSQGALDHRDRYIHKSFTTHSNTRRVTYARWFMEPDPDNLPLTMPNASLRDVLIRFRIGAHPLGVVMGARHNIPRPLRICRLCSMNIVEDEFHMIFECTAYCNTRITFKSIFENVSLDGAVIICDPDAMMRDLFLNRDRYQVARFLSACLLSRQSQLRT